ncbi:hypothetical protein EI171_16395 [Bradyrhizobium sp. LCT2]|nr:hypothetical protein EI171_16395 [Bradyrhizobium sp. LCT2]
MLTADGDRFDSCAAFRKLSCSAASRKVWRSLRLMFDNGCYLVRRLCGLSQEDEGSSLCPEWGHPQYPVLIGRHAHEEICSQVAVQQDPGRPGKSSVVNARQTPIFGRISSSLRPASH